MSDRWPTKSVGVATLLLDSKNPRLGRETTSRSPRDIAQYLFEHDKVAEVAESIAVRGYFPNEPLLAVKEDGRLVVVEGNRRLAALKALRDPSLLSGSFQKQAQRLARMVQDPDDLSKVPVTVAPSRRATDRQIAGRHVGTPVLAWQAENRATFILDKIEEGYTNEQLASELGFSLPDVQEARRIKAIADMARSLDLPQNVRSKLQNPRAKLFTTIRRVFDSTVGRQYLRVEPDDEHGVRGTTTRSEFLKGFRKLVTDVALERVSSRTLNNSDDIKRYFSGWSADDLPKAVKGTFVPGDVVGAKAGVGHEEKTSTTAKPKRAVQESHTVVPKDFIVRFGGERLKDIRRELTRLKRVDYPNASAVLLRVFLELAIADYLERTGEMTKLKEKLKKQGVREAFPVPSLKHLLPEVTRLAKGHLNASDAIRVEKALKYDPHAPFTISELHAFVHSPDIPSERDTKQFWLRTEPLFRLMLETEPGGATT